MKGNLVKEQRRQVLPLDLQALIQRIPLT